MARSVKGEEGEPESSDGTGTTGSRRRVDSQAPTMMGESEPRVRGPVDELAPGEVIGQHYRVARRIGAGGMGSVYVVEHLGLGKRFAAKVVSSLRTDDEAAVGRLRNEARTLSAVEHENIVTVTDLGQTDDGRLFVVMELLEGEDLGSRLTRRQAAGEGDPWLPNAEVRALVPQILSALSAAHGADVVHRDLKPDNLFLAERHGRTVVKVVDFGISKVRGSADEVGLTRTGQILGTPLYMAPEQGKSTATVDARADIYSLGCILYQLFTGRPPFHAESVYECVVKHATEEAPRLSDTRPDLPRGLEAVVRKCLEKDPGSRFQNIAELATAWEAAWEGEDVAGILETQGGVLASTTGSLAARATGARLGLMLGVLALLGLGGSAALFFLSGAERTDVHAREASLVVSPLPSSPRATQGPGAHAGGDSPSEGTPDPKPTFVEPVPVEPPTQTKRIESIPARATVRSDGRVVGRTPFEVEIAPDQLQVLELRRRGYHTEVVRVGADSPDTIEARLRPSRKAPPLAPR